MFQMHIQANLFNCGDKSLAHWVRTQRHCCKIESRIESLNSVGFVWSVSEGRGING